MGVVPQVNYSRPTSMNNPELYAEAYTGRNIVNDIPPLQSRTTTVPNSKV